METHLAFSASAHKAAFARHRLFQTSELDEAREKVARVFCDHRLQVTGRQQRLDTEMCFRQIGGIGIGRMRYGASVSIDPGRLENFALIQMPLSGVETVEHGKHTIRSDAGVASVLSPTLSLKMHHDCGTEKIFVRINRESLERCCRQILGGDIRQPIEFLPEMSLYDARSGPWVRLIQWLCNEISHQDGEAGSMLDSTLFAAQVEQMVITTLLFSQPHNYHQRITDPRPSIAPYFIKRAEQFIDDNAQEPLTIGDIAEHAGVSTRSLFSGFRKYRDTTPMQYLKDVRMRRVREELLKASANSTTVTTVATRWGFAHLGHFTADYKQYFGESPSVTLSR